MKRLLTGALALSLLTGTAAMAQPYNHDNRDDHGGYQQNRHDDRHDNRDFGRNGGNGHHWARGQRMPNTWYQDRSHYVDYRTYHLRAPPRGYRWVRTDDNNFAMVALTTGLIATIIAANH
jgi:Ni/Co efflux regulator RcnB